MDFATMGMSWLNQEIKGFASTVLTYQRPSTSETAQIAMAIGGKQNPLYSLLGSQPGTLDLIQQTPENAVRSFSFDAGDLDFTTPTPETGDQVLEVINGVSCVFQVMPPVSGKLAWEWQNEFRQSGARYLVHTQLVATQ